MRFTGLFATVVLAASAVVNAKVLEVFNPHITSPTAGELWLVGTAQTVTWDVSDIPPSAENDIGLLLLGKPTADSENLDIDNPLATQFPIKDGAVNVTVPSVNDGDNYVVVLFGDSGNLSPEFTIKTL